MKKIHPSMGRYKILLLKCHASIMHCLQYHGIMTAMSSQGTSLEDINKKVAFGARTGSPRKILQRRGVIPEH